MKEPGGRSLSELLAQVAPGTLLRDGLERVLRARMGALVVLGDGPEVLEICSGGFHIDAEMTPQRLSELAKMDGAIILDRRVQRISWANVHLVPDPSAATSETGTRHRTAERVARCVDVPVVAVSEEMGTITLYRSHERRLLRSPEYLGSRANHLIQTLERFRGRLDDVSSSLTISEVSGAATCREVATVLQRAEMLTRVASEIGELLDELGEHGRVLRLELDEMMAGVVEDRRLVLEDYLPLSGRPSPALVLERLGQLSIDDLLGLDHVVAALGEDRANPPGLDDVLVSKGVRVLRRLPQLAPEAAAGLAEHFGSLQGVIRATAPELGAAVGLEEPDARLVKEGLARVVEASILGTSVFDSES